ncbi:MAG: HTTM domain-containing protein [Planctomycetales bacterium]|nr:HTTM domain-containing protein [Planctomycetales bacterium]
MSSATPLTDTRSLPAIQRATARRWPLVAALRRTWRTMRASWFHFWFANQSTRVLELVRIGVGALTFLSYLAMRGSYVELFGANGWITDWAITRWSSHPYHFSVLYDTSSTTVLAALFVLGLAVSAGLCLGLFTRFCKWALLIVQISFVYRNPYITYGFDNLLSSMLFILCLAPVGRQWSVDAWLRRNQATCIRAKYSRWGCACRRLLQIQMVLVFFFAGCHKLRGETWWSGDAFWAMSVSLTYFGEMPLGFFARHYWLVNAVTYGTVLLELAYPFLIWDRRTRPYLLTGAVALHLGIGLLMHLYLFSLLSIFGHLAFLYDDWLISRRPFGKTANG